MFSEDVIDCRRRAMNRFKTAVIKLTRPFVEARRLLPVTEPVANCMLLVWAFECIPQRLRVHFGICGLENIGNVPQSAISLVREIVEQLENDPNQIQMRMRDEDMKMKMTLVDIDVDEHNDVSDADD